MSAPVTRRALITVAAVGAASGTGLLTAAPAVAAPTFRDVPRGAKFYEDVMWAYGQGITKGWGAGSRRTFKPVAPIKRDAMAAFLHRLAGAPSETGNATFKDVHPGMQFREEISWLASTGISEGWDDGTFRPLSTITRDAMAAFLYRMAGSPEHPKPTRAPFKDVRPSMEFSREISWLAESGISEGWSDGTFRPLQSVERGAMAAFLHRYAKQGLRTDIPLLAAPVSSEVRAAEAAILERTNAYRSSRGAPKLTRSTPIDGVARDWSTTMATTGDFSHNPRYAQQIPSGWFTAGENIAYRSHRGDGAATGRALAEQWWNSPPHRENMLKRDFTHLGIGVRIEGGLAYATQVFAGYR